MNDAVKRMQTAAAGHSETYVEVSAEDLVTVCTALKELPLAKSLLSIAERATNTRLQVVRLNRTAHLQPLLEAAAAVPA